MRHRFEIRIVYAAHSVGHLGAAKRTRVECYASLLQYSGNAEYIKRNTARALERGYHLIKLHERTPAAVAAAREVTGPELPTAESKSRKARVSALIRRTA